MKRAEVIATSKRIHKIAQKSHRNCIPKDWEMLADHNRAACLAVARWHLRQMKEASKTYWYSP